VIGRNPGRARCCQSRDDTAWRPCPAQAVTIVAVDLRRSKYRYSSCAASRLRCPPRHRAGSPFGPYVLEARRRIHVISLTEAAIRAVGGKSRKLSCGKTVPGGTGLPNKARLRSMPMGDATSLGSSGVARLCPPGRRRGKVDDDARPAAPDKLAPPLVRKIVHAHEFGFVLPKSEKVQFSVVYPLDCTRLQNCSERVNWRLDEMFAQLPKDPACSHHR
jgi:hypothetical protein